jgi:hypothetical protein
MGKSIVFFVLPMLLFLALSLTGCASTQGQEKVSEILQSHGATQMRKDYAGIIEQLIVYKEKLDLRNPKNYSKSEKNLIYSELKSGQNSIRIKYNNQYLKTYDDYLKVAFDKNNNITDRNDFLILGLYKLIWDTYGIGKGHQITTLSYNQEDFRKLYYYLEVIKWKIRTSKDKNDNYLFITWQNNWQIELQQQLKKEVPPSWELIENLYSIKNHRETIFEHSNFNFEVLLNQMIFSVKNSAKIIGNEPVDIGINAMISVVLFL